MAPVATVRALTMIVGYLSAVVSTVVLLRVGVPWPVAVPVPIGLAMLAWFRWDRPFEVRQEWKAKGLCVGCGYDLTGNVSGVCPECGQASDSASLSRHLWVNMRA